MPKLLKNINIQFISLVKKGANRRNVIFKSAENAPDLHDVEIKKYDDAKQMAYGIVYAPDDLDTHDDYTTKGEIEDAAHKFMKSLNVLNIDKDHSFKPEGAYVAENWIVRKGDPLFPAEKGGAWAVGIKIEDEKLYKEAKEGGFQLSMAGTADKVFVKEDSADEKTMFEKFYTFFKEKIHKEEKPMDEKKIQEMIDASIKKAVDGLAKPMTEEQLAAVVKAAVAAVPEDIKKLAERIEKMEKKTPSSMQDNQDLTADDIKKCDELGAKIAKMAGLARKEG